MQRKKYTIRDLKSYAHKKGGKLLSKKYSDSLGIYKWICKEGHTFKKGWWYLTDNDYWCSKCLKKTNILKRKKMVKEPSTLPHQMKSVYSYKSYRKILFDFYRLTKENDRKFSYQVFSEKARYVSNSFIIDVLSKRKDIATGGAYSFGLAMGLKFRELMYFEALAEYNDSSSKKAKDYYKMKLDFIKK